MGIQKCYCSSTKVAYPLVRAIRDHEQRIVPLPLSLSRRGNRYRFFGIDVTRRVLSRHRNLDWWKWQSERDHVGKVASRYVFGRSASLICLGRSKMSREASRETMRITEAANHGIAAVSTASTTSRWCLFGKRALATYRSQRGSSWARLPIIIISVTNYRSCYRAALSTFAPYSTIRMV